MKSKEIKEFVEEKGFIHVNVLFEVVGNPKEHVENMLGKVMEGIKADKKIVVFNEEFGDAEEAGDGLWGIYCETEMLVKDIATLSWIAFNFSPASIDVKAPKTLNFKEKELTDFFGDLLSQLHTSNARSMQSNSQARSLLVNLNALMRNTILLSVGSGEKTADEIGKDVGASGKDVLPVLDAMLKETALVKVEDKYSRA